MSTLRIGGLDYTLDFDTDELAQNNLEGRVNNPDLVICIRSDRPEEHARVTLWHEMLHAIAYQNNTQIPEKIVDMIAYGVTQILRDNRVADYGERLLPDGGKQGKDDMGVQRQDKAVQDAVLFAGTISAGVDEQQ